MHRALLHRKTLVSLTLVTIMGGCGQILGLGDFTEGSSSTAASSSGSTGGASSVSTTTGSSTTSTNGSGGQSQGGGGTTVTSTTTTGTGGTGGAGGAPCVPTGVEDCSKKGDEDCDGIACSDAMWSKIVGGAGEQNSTGVAVDAQGNVVLAGFFAGTMPFGNKTLISSGMNDYYLAKLSSSGKPIWALQFGDASDNGTAIHVAVDKTGNIFVAGALLASANFGGGLLTSVGGPDVFIAAFDPQGNHIWSKRFGDSGIQRAQSVATDGMGNVVIAGGFGGTINFGGGPLTSPGADLDGFICKYSPNGTLLNAKQIGDVSGQNLAYQEVIGIAIDPAGNILAHGKFSTSVNFGSANLLSGANFAAKFDGSLNHSWSKSLAIGSQIPLIASDSSGSMLLGGGLSGPVVFDGHNVVGGMYSVYVAKFDTLGLFQWFQPSNGTGVLAPIALASDSDGNSIFTGRAYGDANFGNGQLPIVGQDGNLFLAKFGPNGGNALWSKMFGGAGQHDPTAVATDPNTKEILLTGMITQTVDFGAGALNSMGGYDVVVAKFQP